MSHLDIAPWSDAEEVALTLAAAAHLGIDDTKAILRDMAKSTRSEFEIAAKMRELRQRQAA
jgi:hypothetical protein